MPRIRTFRQENRSHEDSVKTALIGGIGNVLLGDDGVGPYVVRLLEALYTFEENVEIADLGTPALDLTQRISGMDTVILVDCVASKDAAGKIGLYRKSEILEETPSQRVDPHSPALSECLWAAELLGCGPENVLLVGIVGKSFEPGQQLSAAVQRSVGAAIEAILQELKQRGFNFEKRVIARKPGIWWCDPEVGSIAAC
jgi:hydrogenase maturation protease